MYNNDLTDVPQLKANSKSAQLTYLNGKYGFTINGTFYGIGGGNMKVYHGKVDLPSSENASVTVNISSLGLTSANDYYVIIDMDANAHYASVSGYWGMGGCYVDEFTATSFKIKRRVSSVLASTVSYQVVYNA